MPPAPPNRPNRKTTGGQAFLIVVIALKRLSLINHVLHAVDILPVVLYIV